MKFLGLVLILIGICVANPIQNGTQLENGRIIGGRIARVGEFPFMAAIYSTSSSRTLFCAGSIVETQWILTAGHCVYGATSFIIQLGSVTLSGTDPNRVRLSTSLGFTHPDYNPQTQENDIGLIKLHLPVVFTDYIVPIFLPIGQNVEEGAEVTIAGWGQVNDQEPGPLDVLSIAELTVISNAECRATYGNAITDNMVCAAGNYNEGTCNGDMGGALAVKQGNLYWHVATAAFISQNGCETIDPSGFTRTFPYVDWITSVVLEGD